MITIQELYAQHQRLLRWVRAQSKDRKLGSDADAASEAVCAQIGEIETAIGKQTAENLDDLLIQARLLAFNETDDIEPGSKEDNYITTHLIRGLVRGLEAMASPQPAALARAAE